jgi:hypothetical protein
MRRPLSYVLLVSSLALARVNEWVNQITLIQKITKERSISSPVGFRVKMWCAYLQWQLKYIILNHINEATTRERDLDRV